MISLKCGYVVSRLNSARPLCNNLVVKQSIELSKLSDGHLFWKAKFFKRLVKSFGKDDDFIVCASMNAGLMKSINRNHD